MNSEENTELKEEKPNVLGLKDKITEYNSRWPIYILHTLDIEGIWLKLKQQLDILEYQKILQELSLEEINQWLIDNSDIDFETNFFEDFLPNYFFFKYKNQIYCYTTGKKGKDKTRIYARFYFDLSDIIKN